MYLRYNGFSRSIYSTQKLPVLNKKNLLPVITLSLFSNSCGLYHVLFYFITSVYNVVRKIHFFFLKIALFEFYERQNTFSTQSTLEETNTKLFSKKSASIICGAVRVRHKV